MKNVIFYFLFFLLLWFSGVRSENRIVGGRNAELGEFPYQVSIRNRGNHDCGGAILDEYWILTAAHCLVGRLASKLTIVAGTVDHEEIGTIYNVSKIVAHPFFNLFTKHDDIGLAKLTEPIQFNNRVQPVKLPEKILSIFARVEAVLTGWGRTKANGNPSTHLQALNVITINLFECVFVHNFIKIRRSNICTFPLPGHGVCYGDSGGPLVSKGEIIGIVSWGIPCAIGKPDVFTKVDNYLPWINRIRLEN